MAKSERDGPGKLERMGPQVTHGVRRGTKVDLGRDGKPDETVPSHHITGHAHAETGKPDEPVPSRHITSHAHAETGKPDEPVPSRHITGHAHADTGKLGEPELALPGREKEEYREPRSDLAAQYATAEHELADLVSAVALRRAEIGPETRQTAAELGLVNYVEGQAVLLKGLLAGVATQSDSQSSLLLSAALAGQAGNLSGRIRIYEAQYQSSLWDKARRAARRLAATARQIARHFAKLVTVAVYIPLGDGTMLTITVQPGPPGSPPSADDGDDGT